MNLVNKIMKIKMNKIVLLALTWLISSMAMAAPELVELHANPLVAGKLSLDFGFSEAVLTVDDKLEYQPNQLVLTIPDASSGLTLNPVPININGVRSVEVIEIEDGLKVVIGLKKLTPYRLVNTDSSLQVIFGETPSSEEDETALAVSTVNAITLMDFRRNKDGGGQFIVDLENDSIAADIRRRDHKIIIEFHSTDISDDQVYIMDVGDYATPVYNVEVFKEKGKVRLELNVKGGFEYHYDQVENQFLVEIDKAKEIKKGEKVFKGKPISLNFQNIPVRTVLQIIADFNGFNLVTTDSVTGNITLRLDGVPWEQALDILLKVKGLDKRLENNVLMVAPATEIAERERQELENDKQVEELAPLYSEYLQVNYAKASELASMMRSGDSSLMTTRGQISVDPRTNTLLVKDTAASLLNIKNMLSKLDIPVRQVVIEARMVTVVDTIGLDLGVRWGATNTGDIGSSTGATSGSLEGINSGSTDQRLNVNLPVSGSSIAFQIAKLGSDKILDLELSALETENNGEIIASPRITTANQKPASISQGTSIPYLEASSSGAATVKFVDAVLLLDVTPQITPNGSIILDLNIKQDSVGEAVTTPTGLAMGINTQEIKTQILVGNGETVVLGGIFTQDASTTVTKVPFLGDIPGIGFLFRSKTNKVRKNELLIFVTPRIVADSGI